MNTARSYNHVFSLQFQMGGSLDIDGNDITPQAMYDAIVARAKRLLENDEIIEAVGLPCDSCAEHVGDASISVYEKQI